MSIDSKAGLIGFYEGTIKFVLRTLKDMPEKDKTPEIKGIISGLEVNLKEGDEAWQVVKGS
jgi:hypothetical protein